MKKSNNFEIIDAQHILNQNQITLYKSKLKQLKKMPGIISLCIDEKSLFIEYFERDINLTSIKNLLSQINFPLKENVIKLENKASLLHI